MGDYSDMILYPYPDPPIQRLRCNETVFLPIYTPDFLAYILHLTCALAPPASLPLGVWWL